MHLRRVLLATFVVGAVSRPAAARADVIESCAASATSGQELQRHGRLRVARARFLGCLKAECPSEVKAVCDQLLTVLEASTPTVIFGARDATGSDLADVRVELDGAPVLERLDGKAMAVDPGPHVVRFERRGAAAIQEDVLIHEGEKNRLLSARFGPAFPPDSAGGTARTPSGAYVLGALGLVSLGASFVLAVHGQGQYDACSPRPCSASTLDAISIQADAAWVTLGVGVVSLGAATWLFLSRPAQGGGPAVGVTVGPRSLSVEGSF